MLYKCYKITPLKLKSAKLDARDGRPRQELSTEVIKAAAQKLTAERGYKTTYCSNVATLQKLTEGTSGSNACFTTSA